MNMDLYGLFEFGDEDAVKQFALAHRFAHEAEAAAVNAQFGAQISTYDVGSEDIVTPWIAIFRGEVNAMPQSLNDWLELHNENHEDMWQFLAGGNIPATITLTDLSQVNFADPEQMYTWLTNHQQIHQAEQQLLGLT